MSAIAKISIQTIIPIMITLAGQSYWLAARFTSIDKDIEFIKQTALTSAARVDRLEQRYFKD